MSYNNSKNKALLRRIYEEMWNQGQPAVAAEIFEKPAGVQEFVTGFLESFPDLQHAVEEILEDGDKLAARFTARGTHTGRWLEFAPTHKVIHYSGVTWVRIVNGKISDHKTWWDKAGLIDQIGG